MNKHGELRKIYIKIGRLEGVIKDAEDNLSKVHERIVAAAAEAQLRADKVQSEPSLPPPIATVSDGGASDQPQLAGGDRKASDRFQQGDSSQNPKKQSLESLLMLYCIEDKDEDKAPISYFSPTPAMERRRDKYVDNHDWTTLGRLCRLLMMSKKSTFSFSKYVKNAKKILKDLSISESHFSDLRDEYRKLLEDISNDEKLKGLPADEKSLRYIANFLADNPSLISTTEKKRWLICCAMHTAY